MCGLCGVTRAEHHWSESPLTNQFQTHRERLEHIKFINEILTPFRFNISDFANNSYILKKSTGRTDIIQGFNLLWKHLDEKYGINIDPLDDQIINALRDKK